MINVLENINKPAGFEPSLKKAENGYIAPPCSLDVSGLLKESAERSCPSCGAGIFLEAHQVMDGEIMDCPDCALELEVVADPSTIDPDKVAKAHKGFEASWIDRTIAPTLVPAPAEEEDWGE